MMSGFSGGQPVHTRNKIIAIQCVSRVFEPSHQALTCKMTTTFPRAIPASLLYARISWTLALNTGTTQPELLWARSVHT